MSRDGSIVALLAWMVAACDHDPGVLKAEPLPEQQRLPVTSVASSTWYGESADSWAGDRIHGLGSVGGAGLDLIVGAKGLAGAEANEGGVYLLVDQVGPEHPSATLADARLKLTWPVPDPPGVETSAADPPALGVAVEGLVDPTDRRQHVGYAIGAHRAGASGEGALWVLAGDALQDGPASLELDLDLAQRAVGVNAVQRWHGPVNGGMAGLSLDSGDVDGDGAADVVVGSFAGAWLLLGPFEDSGQRSLADEASAQIVGVSADPLDTLLQTGCSVAVVDDFHGDGRAGVAVGSCSADVGGAADNGQVAVLTHDALQGVDPYVLGQAATDVLISGDADGDSLGVTITDAGDVTGDGAGDVLVLAHSCGVFGGGCNTLGRTTWWVVGGGIEAASGRVSEVAALEVGMEEPNLESCNAGDAGELAGAAGRDLVFGICPDTSGSTVILVDPPPTGTFRVPHDADYVFEGRGEEQAGAEVHVAGSALVIGAWKSDWTDLPDAGAVYVLDLPSLGL